MTTLDFVGLWLHVLALAAYGGATFALIAIIVPASAGQRPDTRHSFLAQSLRFYDPLAVATLGVIVMTGAFNLTRYKEAMRDAFFAELGWLLVWKLAFAFVVVMIGTYIAFGLGHRIVRAEMAGEPFDPEQLSAMSWRLVYAGSLNLLLLAVTAWLGLEFGHPHR
jgi:uncharacterized membrane protein